MTDGTARLQCPSGERLQPGAGPAGRQAGRGQPAAVQRGLLQLRRRHGANAVRGRAGQGLVPGRFGRAARQRRQAGRHRVLGAGLRPQEVPRRVHPRRRQGRAHLHRQRRRRVTRRDTNRRRYRPEKTRVIVTI